MLALPREVHGQILCGAAGEQEHFLDAREIHHEGEHREVEGAEPRSSMAITRPTGNPLGNTLP